MPVFPTQDFSKRDTTPELMDTEQVSFEDFRNCLEQLSQSNRLALGYRPTLRFLDQLKRDGHLATGRPVSIVDVGSGYGDLVRRIDQWAEANGVVVDLQGVDMNPWSAKAASEVTEKGRPIRWISQNLFDYKPERPVDIVVSSLFTHHLKAPDLVRFVKWMEATAQLGWFVSDLRRHPLPYYAMKAGFPLLRRHRFMHHDGPVSVASAFVEADWRATLSEAGLDPRAASIDRRLPFRLCVSRIKN